jgi:hypothetical protein
LAWHDDEIVSKFCAPKLHNERMMMRAKNLAPQNTTIEAHNSARATFRPACLTFQGHPNCVYATGHLYERMEWSFWLLQTWNAIFWLDFLRILRSL